MPASLVLVGQSPIFNDHTQFLSTAFIAHAAFAVSALAVIPSLYRLFDLAKHEKGRPTIFGQFASICAFAIPTLYLSTLLFYWDAKPGSKDAFSITVAYIVAILQTVQDGRVNVSSPEVLLFWATKTGVHGSWAIDSYLRQGMKKSTVPAIIALLSLLALVLELNNPDRHPDGSMDDRTVFSLISSDYATPVMKAGSRGRIYTDDFISPPKSVNALTCYDEFERYLARAPNSRHRIMVAFFGSLRWKLVGFILAHTIEELCLLIQPRFLQLFLASLSDYLDDKGPLYVSYYYALLCGVLPMIGACFENLGMLTANISQVSLRVSLFSAIYRKGLSLSPSARERYSTSKIMNLISTDSDHIFQFLEVLPFIASLPIILGFSWWQLWHFLGPTFLAALAVYALVIPFSAFLSTSLNQLYTDRMEACDTRVEHTTNALRNIKSLKLYAWEIPFYKKILEARNNSELRLLRSIMYFISVLDEAWEVIGPLVTMAVFSAFLYFEQGALVPDIVFPAIFLLEIATTPFLRLPWVMQTLGRTLTSQKRISDLLNEEDHDHANYHHVTAGVSSNPNLATITASSADISWTGDTEHMAIHQLSLTAKRGDLVCITGHVGSGKTAILKALGGEMAITSGDIALNGTLAYCSQEAWLQNLTLRENIVFGQEFDEEWYKLVLNSCELVADIDNLPDGDNTDLGVRGVSLSGGQKARVALARAVYSRADILLLDDVLSAVDEHVGGQLIKKLFSSEGLLATRTVILATHSIKVLPHSSQIIALKNKTIEEHTSFSDICKNPNQSEVFRIISEFGTSGILDTMNNSISIRPVGEAIFSKTMEKFSKPLRLVQLSTRHVSDDDEEHDELEDPIEAPTKSSSISVYKSYFEELRSLDLPILISLVATSVTVNCLIIVYMGWVSKLGFTTFAEGRTYLLAYLCLILFGSFSNLVGNWWLYVKLAIKISQNLHEIMLWNVMRAPMSFFDVTPLGRLVNRFTHDIESLDDEIPWAIMLCLHTFLQLFITVLMVTVGNPVVVLIIVPGAWFGNNIRKLFTPTRRKVTRITTASHSPILSHIEDSMTGQATIRMFGRIEQFLLTYEQRADYWIKAKMFSVSIERWLVFRMEALTMALTLVASLSVTHLIGMRAISVGYAGVINNLAMKTGMMVRDAITFYSKLETQAVSLRRILEYVNVKQEARYEMDNETAQWPIYGAVKFDKLWVRYSNDGPDVLKGVSLDIKAREKIGIVGRTGSGKSTLSLSIFRIVEAFQGQIVVDGVDVSTLGLKELRSKISIIPQDAQIFNGTVRDNLDPLGIVDDTRLWEVLELCHLKEFIQSRTEGLDAELNDSGNSISRGQSQLLCLGRALIHESSVLVLDEATASVDVETDQKVQDTIRKHFQQRTIITIAHRLNTIMSSDRIAVLVNGGVKEFDTPANLLQQRGLFYDMYNDGK